MQSALFPPHQQRLSTASRPQGRVFPQKLLPWTRRRRKPSGPKRNPMTGDRWEGASGRGFDGLRRPPGFPVQPRHWRLIWAWATALPLPLHWASGPSTGPQAHPLALPGAPQPILKRIHFQFSAFPQPPGGQLECSPLGTS